MNISKVLPPTKTLLIGGYAMVVILLFTCMKTGYAGVKQQEKKVTITLTAKEWKLEADKLNYVAHRLRYTNLAASEVTYLQDSILVPLQITILTNINQQAKDTINKK